MQNQMQINFDKQQGIKFLFCFFSLIVLLMVVRFIFILYFEELKMFKNVGLLHYNSYNMNFIPVLFCT